MLGSDRRTIECKHTPTLEDPVDDGLSEVLVVEHMAPGRQWFVGSEDPGKDHLQRCASDASTTRTLNLAVWDLGDLRLGFGLWALGFDLYC